MNQLENFSTFLRWLRYSQELKLSDPFGSESSKEAYNSPLGLPKLPKLREYPNDDGLRIAANSFQKRRKRFEAKITKCNPGFFMNFLHQNFVKLLLEYLIENDLMVEVKVLNIPFAVFKKEDGIIFYDDAKDLPILCEIWDATGLYIKCLKLTISDGIYVFSIKMYQHEDVMTFWEPSFVGNMPKLNLKAFLKHIAKIKINDILGI